MNVRSVLESLILREMAGLRFYKQYNFWIKNERNWGLLKKTPTSRWSNETH